MDNQIGNSFNRICQKLVLGDNRKSQASQLVDLVMSRDVSLFHTPEFEPYAEIFVTGHHECWPIRSMAFRRWIGQQFYEETEKVPTGQAIQHALLILEGHAIHRGEQKAVYLRMAEFSGAIYVDLCDEHWRVVRIQPSGWDVINYSPVAFRRTRGMQPLPIPSRGGTLEPLRGLLHVTDDTSWILMVSWLMAALRPRGPYPALIVHGEQGASKSWTGKTLRSLVDPNVSGLRGEPRDCRDLMIAANNGWVIAFDNLSRIEPWLSDALCRLSTGGGLATRQLYSDTDETILDAQRPLLLTSIEEICTRGDLLDRSIVVQLEPIPPERRREEEALERDLASLRPAILGALLDGVVEALKNLHNVKLTRLPRMADFASWMTAAEPGLGWKSGTFMNAYVGNREHAHQTAIEGSLPGSMLRAWFGDRMSWTGTASELLTLIGGHAGESVTSQRGWPRNANALSGHIRRLAPNLRAVGLNVVFNREPTAKRTRTITVERACYSSSSASGTSEPTEQHLSSNGSVAMSPRANEEALSCKPMDDRTQQDAEKHVQSHAALDEEVIDLAD